MAEKKCSVSNKELAELEELLQEEVRTNQEGFPFVDFSTIDGAASLMKPKMNQLHELGFRVSGVRAGFDNRLRVWLERGGDE